MLDLYFNLSQLKDKKFTLVDSNLLVVVVVGVVVVIVVYHTLFRVMVSNTQVHTFAHKKICEYLLGSSLQNPIENRLKFVLTKFI